MVCGGGLGGNPTGEVEMVDGEECCIYDTSENCGKIIDSGQCCVEGMAWRSGKEDYEFCGDDCKNGELKGGDSCCGLKTFTASQQCCPGDVVMGKSEQCPGSSQSDPHVVPFCGDPYDL
jgi:hypothetical protein